MGMVTDDHKVSNMMKRSHLVCQSSLNLIMNLRFLLSILLPASLIDALFRRSVELASKNKLLLSSSLKLELCLIYFLLLLVKSLR